MSTRWDETWHRLREWTNGQGPSERLAAQVLLAEGYTDLDPSHPLGGPDGLKDAVCRKDGLKWVMAVFFPRGQQSLAAIKRKFLHDLDGVARNDAHALAFVTNQELIVSDRETLKEAAGGVLVEVYHLDRITTILDQPSMSLVRKQFLLIDSVGDERLELLGAFLAGWQRKIEAVHGLVPREPGWKWYYEPVSAIRGAGGDDALLAELDELTRLEDSIRRNKRTEIRREDVDRLDAFVARVRSLNPRQE